MKAVIFVPETGSGEISAIHEPSAVSKPPQGEMAVEVEAPGVPIDQVHWDGGKVVQGAYLPPGFLEEQARQEAAKQAVDNAQNLLISRLTHFDYDLTTSLIARMSPDPDLAAALDSATTVAELKAVMKAILGRITLTEQELALMNGYRAKYEDWVAKKDAAPAAGG